MACVPAPPACCIIVKSHSPDLHHQLHPSPLPAPEVMSFEDERELLLRWRDLVLEADPDIIIGAAAAAAAGGVS